MDCVIEKNLCGLQSLDSSVVSFLKFLGPLKTPECILTKNMRGQMNRKKNSKERHWTNKGTIFGKQDRTIIHDFFFKRERVNQQKEKNKVKHDRAKK